MYEFQGGCGGFSPSHTGCLSISLFMSPRGGEVLAASRSLLTSLWEYKSPTYCLCSSTTFSSDHRPRLNRKGLAPIFSSSSSWCLKRLSLVVANSRSYAACSSFACHNSLCCQLALGGLGELLESDGMALHDNTLQLAWESLAPSHLPLTSY